MTAIELLHAQNQEDYDFLNTNPHLGFNICILGLGGSYAYGTNVDGSDIDIRGVATNSKRDILTGHDFEQVVNEKTDTTIYSVEKIFKLLSSCNPNTIEILGLNPDQYIYVNDVGRKILDNKTLFLSKIAVHSFGGYANSQLRRLENKCIRDVEQEKREEHILHSMQNAMYSFFTKYTDVSGDALKLYIDKAVNKDFSTEIFADICLTHYPLRDYLGLYSELSNILHDYTKLGARNENAMSHNKLAKHMMHLIRLYLMCFDILEKKEIKTYRDTDHDFLMNIRNGKYLDENNHVLPEFYDIVAEYEQRLNYDKNNTDLPEKPNYEKINDLLYDINYSIISK